MIDNQVRSLRTRQVIASFESHERAGAYWGARTDIANYQLADALPCPVDKTTLLANTPTRLKALADSDQMRLINWGYAVCDAAMRKHVDSSLAAPADFPYPAEGVG
jgi:NTE family protein